MPDIARSRVRENSSLRGKLVNRGKGVSGEEAILVFGYARPREFANAGERRQLTRKID